MHAERGVISGSVNGNVVVADKLEIGATARIRGSVTAKLQSRTRLPARWRTMGPEMPEGRSLCFLRLGVRRSRDGAGIVAMRLSSSLVRNPRSSFSHSSALNVSRVSLSFTSSSAQK